MEDQGGIHRGETSDRSRDLRPITYEALPRAKV